MGLDNDSITERFRELELERRRIEAEMAAVVAVADARGVYGDDGHRSIKGWMRANANWSGCDVSTMRRVVALFESCPAVGDALLAGHIGQAQVIELARARSNPRCGARLVEVLELLLDNAEHLSFEDFRTVVRRWEHFADEDGTLEDAETNHANRTAGLHEVNGCVDLRASGGRPLDAAEMLGIFERFVEDEFRADVAARTELHGPDAPASLLPRTDAQRRFDALLRIFRTASSMPAGARAPEPVVNIVCDIETFETLLARHRLIPFPDDLPLTDLARSRSETDSGIVVPPEHLLQAALQGHVRRVIVDADGVVLDMGRKRRLFKGAARVAAKLMACHCGHPGCTIGAHYAEVDHLDEWHRDGGATDVANSGIRCRSHNPIKHRLGLVDRRSKTGQVVTFRRDGTPMLPVGCRLPEFEPDPEESEHEGSEFEVHDEFADYRLDTDVPLIEARLRIMKRLVADLEQELERQAAALTAVRPRSDRVTG